MVKVFFSNRILLKKILTYSLLYIFTASLIVFAVFLSPDERNDFPIFRAVIVAFASILLCKYFVYMFLSPWYDIVMNLRLQKTHAKLKKPYAPNVSIVIPAWNEEIGICTTIHSILKSTYKNLEIVVVNNASTDNTEANVLRLMSDYNQKIKLEKGEHIQIVYAVEMMQGKGHALNKGLTIASGELIMSIDADCYVKPNTVENFVQYFADPTVAAAVGNVRIGNTNTIIGVIQYLEFLFSFYFKKADGLMNTIYIIGGAAGCFRKSIFHKIGQYSVTNITEDIELSVRIQSAGMKIVYAQDALVFTEGATDIRGLMKQRLRWKRGRFETFAEHKKLFFSKRKEHNKILSWVILPLALFGELQLSLEPFFLFFLYIFSYLSNDYSSLISGIIVVSSMFAVQIGFDNRKETRLGFILLAPIGWLLFYVSTFVEAQALTKALWGYVRGTELKWQKWERNGVFSHKNP